MRITSPLVSIMLLVSQSGCATIISSERQHIRFTSEPHGAKVYIDGAPMGQTPAFLPLKTRTPHDVRITKEGYEEHFATLERRVNGWTFGNIGLLLLGIIPGIAGFIVDAATGANFQLVPETVHA